MLNNEWSETQTYEHKFFGPDWFEVEMLNLIWFINLHLFLIMTGECKMEYSHFIPYTTTVEWSI